jgi:hypothetical protein
MLCRAALCCQWGCLPDICLLKVCTHALCCRDTVSKKVMAEHGSVVFDMLQLTSLATWLIVACCEQGEARTTVCNLTSLITNVSSELCCSANVKSLNR